MAAASYQWFADDEEIEGADEATLLITEDMVGKIISVKATAEDMEEATATCTEPVEPFGIIEIESAEATSVNEILVALAYSIDPLDTVVTVTKGTNDVPATVTWDADCKSATITTAAKMTKGTYTVTVSSVEDPTNTDSETVDIEDQKVAAIVILPENGVALTGENPGLAANNKNYAYAYYDVLDQYGESLRTSASIQWSGSADITAHKTNGQLVIKKIDGKDWVYNEQIYVTGVYTKTGVTASATLTVGTEQNLDTIEPVGFVKKGSTDIIQDLPADFKAGEYYMLFNALDQNGNALAAVDIDKEDVTFISDNVLVVKELNTNNLQPMTISGTEHCAVPVTPGLKVADGGEVTVTAIANKTGNKTEVNFVVGEDAVVASFTMSQPTGTVADGDQKVEIPFVAKDQDGNDITNFRTLAKQETFNTLSFTASEGELVLAEQDNGTAKLTWSDKNMPWSDAQTTDGIDRPISLTAIVVGGETDNEMVYVSDKRRPDAVANVNMNSVYVEGATIAFTAVDSFKFYDQYGTLIKDEWGADNGFFAAATAGQLKGTDFANHEFGVRVKNAGSGEIVLDTAATAPIARIVDATTKEYVVTTKASEKSIQFATKTDIQSAATGEGFKFEIAKFKTTGTGTRTVASDWDAVSTSKYMPVTVVDITQVKNLTVGSLNTFYVGPLDVTGKGIIKDTKLTDLKKDSPVLSVETTNADKKTMVVGKDYKQDVTVSGTYNGTTVTVPAVYFSISANKLKDTDGAKTATKNVEGKVFEEIIPYVATTAESGLKAEDLYDKTTANGTAKFATDEVTATVSKIYDAYYWAWNATTMSLEKYYVADYASEANPATAAKNAADATLNSATNKTNAQNELGAEAQLAAINTILPASAAIDETKLATFLAGDYTTGTTGATNTAADAITNAATGKRKAVTDAYGAADMNALAKKEAAAWIEANGLTKDTTLPATTDFTATGLSNDNKTAIVNYLTAVKAELVAEDGLATAANNAVTTTAADTDAAYRAIPTNSLRDIADTLAPKVKEDPTVDTGALCDGAGLTGDDKTKVKAYLDKLALEVKAENELLLATEIIAVDAAERAKYASDAEVEATFAEALADNAAAQIDVYDVAKKTITLSDQAPHADKIAGLKASYTFNPTDTEVTNTNIKTKLKDVKVVDQYGVATGDALTLTVTNAKEAADGYAENNFKVTGNSTPNAAIVGAEIGDTFDLVVSCGEIKETTAVTVGADTWASISSAWGNLYKNQLEPTLEEQREAGLG